MSDILYCDDPDEEDRPPTTRPWTATDQLRPKPPRGWLKAWSFGAGGDPRDLAIWLLCLKQAQHFAREDGFRQHVVCRDARGHRVLLVDPAHRADVDELLADVNDRVQNCNCGGTDCLDPEAQERAAVVFARRRWREMSVVDRLEALGDEAMPVTLALDESGAVAFGADGGSGLAYQVATTF